MKVRNFILFASLLAASLPIHAQTDNTLYVKQFAGTTVGQKVASAMLACNSSTVVPCILVIDPSLAAYNPGTMPTLCSTCSLADFRTGWPTGSGAGYAGVTTDGANGIKAAGAVATNALVPNLTTLVCEGDSITFGFILSSSSQRYCDVAMTLPALNGRGVTEVMAAISGSKIADLASRYATAVKPYCTAGGAILSVMVGTNDLGAGAEPASTTWTAIQSYLATAKADGCTILLHTVLPRQWSLADETQRLILNEDIRTSTSYTFLSDDDQAIQDPYDSVAFSDGLHPDAAVHAHIAAVMNTALKGASVLTPIVYPQQIFQSPTYQYATALASATDLNTVTQCGSYDGTGLTDTPTPLGSGWVRLLVMCDSSIVASGYASQLATSLTGAGSTNAAIYFRREVAFTWDSWIQIYPVAATLLTTSTDLNTLKTCGTYDLQTPVNAPGSYSWLRVFVMCDSSGLFSNYASQLASTVTDPNAIWFRTDITGTWGAWMPLYQLKGTSGSIGGSALTAGTCATGTVAITGLTTAMGVTVTPVTYPGDAFTWSGYASSSGTATVRVCTDLAAGATPTASTYNVRVIP